MNEFVEQFLLESRELVEQGTADLLALEKTPSDPARLDGAFRAFHTLKGGAAIVDFNAMAHAVHAAEDVLAAVRSGTRIITPELIGDCLTCLDQVVQWLDVMGTTGELPPHAMVDAEIVAARFAASANGAAHAAASAPANWIETLTDRHPGLGAKAATAVRYTPAADCFYAGTDPLARIAALPGLLAVELNPLTPWPPLDALDPFVCNLVITALTQSSRDEVAAALGDAVDHCEVRTVAHDGGAPESSRLPPLARELIEAQLLLLAETAPQGAAGRMASAGVVAENVLRSAGEAAAAAQVAQARETTLSANDPRHLREAIEAVMRVEPAPAAVQPVPGDEREVTALTLRIPASRVDALVDLTGELLVAKNAIGHAAKLAEEAGGELDGILKDRYAVLHRLVGELQRSVLGMRVLPLRHVFQRFPRLVREIARDTGKPASLVIEGGETEADKAIVEMLFEPLLHVLRNAIDHGIENAAARAASHKPPVATIRIRAVRQAEHVVVEVADDGGGMNVARIREVARERAIATEEILAAMSDQEAIDLVFEPGFSTAQTVTGLSGRGVGMDAVRTAVHRLAGRVNIESRAGQGTTVRFTLPFSVMLTRVMIVGTGEQTFGIPLDAVVETLRIGTDKISPLGSMHAVVLRNRTIPLITLDGALGLTAKNRHEAEATLVITNIDGHYGAIRVDRIGERMEAMLKPLDGLLAGMRGLAGSTLLGDGSVLLVLDLEELFQ